MRVAVCDDDHVAGEGLCRMVQEAIPIECCKYYDDTEELCETIAAGELFDALLLDIEWKGRGTGLLAAEKIRKTAPAIQIVYVTGYTMKYVEAVFFSSVRPCAFLTKPVKPEQLQKSLRKAEELLKKEQTDYFLLRHRAKTAKIPYQDILFLESEKHRTHIHLRNGSVEYSPQKLDRLAEQFPKTFLRVHKSFLVNLSGIQKLDQGGHQFVMENGCEIMISRSYYAASKEAFFCYIRSKAFGGEKLNELL